MSMLWNTEVHLQHVELRAPLYQCFLVLVRRPPPASPCSNTPDSHDELIIKPLQQPDNHL